MKYLESKSSLRQQKIALLIFCLLFAGSSLAILIETLTEQEPNETLFDSGHSNIQHFSQPEGLMPLTNSDTINLLELRKQLDSLSLAPDGINQIKQFEEKHPGILNKLKDFKK